MSLETKCFHLCLKNLKPSEIFRRMTTKKKHSKFLNKDPQKQLEDLIFDFEWSPSLQKFLKEEGRQLNKFHKYVNET